MKQDRAEAATAREAPAHDIRTRSAARVACEVAESGPATRDEPQNATARAASHGVALRVDLPRAATRVDLPGVVPAAAPDQEQRSEANAHGAELKRSKASRRECAESDAAQPTDPDWRALLAGASPREVLARLTAGDPLALRPRVAQALAEHAYLLDADRVWLRAVARVARFSTRYRGEPALGRWLRGQIDDALGDCLVEQCEAAADGQASSSTLDVLARPLGLSTERMHAACVAFNACAPLERRAFVALLLDRMELEPAASRLGQSPTECARAARRALEVVMAAATASSASSAKANASGVGSEAAASSAGADGALSGGGEATDTAQEATP